MKSYKRCYKREIVCSSRAYLAADNLYYLVAHN
jgi:hypothetical protein